MFQWACYSFAFVNAGVQESSFCFRNFSHELDSGPSDGYLLHQWTFLFVSQREKMLSIYNIVSKREV